MDVENDFYSKQLKDTSWLFRFLYKHGIIHDIQKYAHISVVGFISLLLK